MLNIMRKHAQSWLIKGIMVILAAVFVLYFGTMRENKHDNKAAVVNGQVITAQEHEKAYFEVRDLYRAQYKDMWSEELAKALDLKNMTLENLINQVLIDQEAKRLGFAVTKEEIQQAIMSVPAFKTNDRFDMRRYRALLNQRRMKPEDFEQGMANELLSDKLKQYLSAFSVVTDQEVRDRYAYTHEEIKVGFVRFDPGKYRESTPPDQTAINNFFDQHREQYREPEKVRITYIEINPKTFEAGVDISEQQIKDYYEENLDSYTEPEQVRARHILFKLDKDAPDATVAEVKAKAEDVLKQAREGKDFAKLAEKYSEGPTRSRGGDLGYFSKGQMVKPFEDAAFGLKAGEISGLVLTQFGYHILKVEDVKEAGTKTLEQVNDSIKKTLTHNIALDQAYDKGLSLANQMPYDVDLAKFAAEQNLTVTQTDFIPQNGSIPGIAADRNQAKTIFSLGKHETSELMEINGIFYIFQVTSRKESFIPELNEIESKVKEDLTDHLAAEKAKTAAGKILEELRKGNPWKELIEKEGLKIEESDFFNRQGSVPGMAYEPDLMADLFKLNESNRYPERVFENETGAFIFRFEGYKGVDEDIFEKEKEKQRYAMLQEKQTMIFENWLKALREKAEIVKSSKL